MITASEARERTEKAILQQDLTEIEPKIEEAADGRKRELPLGRPLESVTRRELEGHGYFVDHDADDNAVIKW